MPADYTFTRPAPQSVRPAARVFSADAVEKIALWVERRDCGSRNLPESMDCFDMLEDTLRTTSGVPT